VIGIKLSALYGDLQPIRVFTLAQTSGLSQSLTQHQHALVLFPGVIFGKGEVDFPSL